MSAVAFVPNKKFRREYRKLWKEDPQAANLYLLMCELADKDGQVRLPADEKESKRVLAELMTARFNDLEEYAL